MFQANWQKEHGCGSWRELGSYRVVSTPSDCRVPTGWARLMLSSWQGVCGKDTRDDRKHRTGQALSECPTHGGVLLGSPEGRGVPRTFSELPPLIDQRF